MKDEVSDTFVLDAGALKAHSDFKQAITSAPILALPRSSGLYVLEALASATQQGDQLLQER